MRLPLLLIVTNAAVAAADLFRDDFSRFAPGLKAGVPVRRGELIGFVGSTGPALDGTIVPMTTAIGLARILCLVPHRVLVPKS